MSDEVREKTRRSAFTFEILEELWEEDVEIVGLDVDMKHRLVYFHIYHKDFDRVEVVEGQPLRPTRPGVMSEESPVAFRKTNLPELDMPKLNKEDREIAARMKQGDPSW